MNIIKGGMQTITGATLNEMKVLKEMLTLDNPAYLQAKRFSRYRFTNIPPTLPFYIQNGKDLIVPRGVKIPFPHSTQDNRILVNVKYPKFKIKLRDVQQEAYETYIKNTDNGVIVLPTGVGKSILGIYLACKLKQKCLVIVQKDDLIDGWREDIKLTLGLRPKQIGLIKGKDRRIGEQITLCTIQTLSRLSPTEVFELINTFGMVIQDEFHRSVANTYEILKHFEAKYLVGLTATDMRNDGLQKVLYWLFGDACFRYTGNAGGDILPYSVVIKNIDYLEYKAPIEYYYGNSIVNEEQAMMLKAKGKFIKRKSLDPQVLKEFVKNERYNLEVARDVLKEFKKEESILCFLHEKEHIRSFYALLISIGIPEYKIQLYYGDSKEKDSDMKKRAESKQVLITLATFAKATEGTNIKALSRVFLITSINNEKNTIQAVGRIRRSKIGKKDAIVYDYRFPNVQGLCNHGKTRDLAYKSTGGTFNSETPPKPRTTRGFKK